MSWGREDEAPQMPDENDVAPPMMNDGWRMSAQVNEIAEALAKAQASMKGAMKDSQNPHFKSSYADLASVWDACREPLTANGISVVQMPMRSDNVTAVQTLLLHKSGQWITNRISAVMAKMDPQGVGSCITYLRRYALAAMAGVAPEDDDGNASSYAPSQNGGGRQPVQASATRQPQQQRQQAAQPDPEPAKDPEAHAAEKDAVDQWEGKFAEVETEEQRQTIAKKFKATNPSAWVNKQVERFYKSAAERIKAAAQNGAKA